MLNIVSSLGKGVIDFAFSPVGRLIVVFCVGWFLSARHGDEYWSMKINEENARREAVWKAEVARQAQAAQEIAAAATARAEEDAQIEKELRYVIQSYQKGVKPDASQTTHLIDDHLFYSLQQLDAANRRTPAPPRRPTAVRNPGKSAGH